MGPVIAGLILALCVIAAAALGLLTDPDRRESRHERRRR